MRGGGRGVTLSAEEPVTLPRRDWAPPLAESRLDWKVESDIVGVGGLWLLWMVGWMEGGFGRWCARSCWSVEDGNTLQNVSRCVCEASRLLGRKEGSEGSYTVGGGAFEVGCLEKGSCRDGQGRAG